ncbi:O-antigen ligase family protein [Phormidium sp. CCY1219]|uniref:O-antigen ligase family protein n=1 Tax=Phormidium sp. CCY1219 TaxID=2886104 RepID=UPI002D1F2E66|nr:O-antigen ligase family protein [Phormidium sp. CCY1219]MEB3826326.1 O-antigen ligase family protein [Phormidium sp. CCY1219]
MIFLGLLLATLLAPLRILPGNNRIDIVLIPIAAVGLILTHRSIIPEVLKNNRYLAIALSLFFAWIWVVVGWSDRPGIAIKYSLLYSIYILVFCSLFLVNHSNRHNPKQRKIYHLLIFYFLIALAVFGIIEYFFPDLFIFHILGSLKYLNHYPRVSSLVQNPNQFGVLMSLAVALTLCLRQQHFINPLEFCLGLILPITADSLSASRNGWIILGLAIVLGWFYKLINRKEFLVLILFWLITLLIFPVSTYRLGITDNPVFPVMQWVGENQSEVANSIPNPTSTALSRTFLWKAAIAETLQHPFTGIGLGVYAEEVGRRVFGRIGFNAHNIFLNISAETGITGLLIFNNLLLAFFGKANLRKAFGGMFLILILTSQLPDFFIGDPTFTSITLYFIALACNTSLESENYE